jgi:transcriptional regulator with XRE-family HTH domain
VPDDITVNITAVARLKHGDLWAALKERGWTQADFARHMGWSPSKAGKWINMRKLPRKLSFTDEESLKLVTLTGKLPEELWPPFIRGVATDIYEQTVPLTQKVIDEVDARRALLPAPEREFTMAQEQTDLEIKMKLCLSDRQREALERRHGLSFYKPHALWEVGNALGVSQERVRQIIAVAENAVRWGRPKERRHGRVIDVEPSPKVPDMEKLNAWAKSNPIRS